MDTGALQSVSSLTALPIDWLIIGVFAALLSFDAMRSGSARAAALAIALPLTQILLAALPSAIFAGSIASQFPEGRGQALLFAIVFALLFLAVYRIVYSFSDMGGMLQGVIAGVSAAAIAVVIWLQVPALESVWHFGPQVHALFGEPYRFWWLVAAYFGLASFRG